MIHRLGLRSGAAIAGVPILAFAVWLLAGMRDTLPPEDDDLSPTPVAIDPADDAYAHLRVLFEHPYFLSSDLPHYDELREMILGEHWDRGLAIATLTEHADSIRAIESALQAPDFDLSNTLWESDRIHMLWGQPRLLLLRAWLALDDGDEASALADVRAVLELATRQERAHGAVALHTVAALVQKRVALDTLVAMLPRLDLDAARARSSIADLEAYRSDPSAWDRMWLSEYQAGKSIADRADPPTADALRLVFSDPYAPLARAADWLPTRYLLHPNASLRVWESRVRRARSWSRRPCAELPTAPQPEISDHALAFQILLPNGYGRVRAARSDGTLIAFIERRCLTDALISGVQALIAARAFEAATGRFPAEIDELVPAYLEDVPTPLALESSERAVYFVPEGRRPRHRHDWMGSFPVSVLLASP